MDDAQALARKHYAAFNARDFAAYGEDMDENVTVVSDAGVTVGRGASVAMAQTLARQFPDLMVEVERMTVAPGSVICELRLEGLRETDEHGVEHPVATPSLLSQIIDVRDGKVVALRTYRSLDAQDPGAVGRLRTYGHDRGLTTEHAASRHVSAFAAVAATLDEVLAAAVVEASALLGGATSTLLRYDDDPDTATVVARTDGGGLGARVSIAEDAAAASIRRSGLAQRVDDRRGTFVGVPIVLEDGPWGILTVRSAGGALPADTARRLSDFAHVIASAIANAGARAELRRLVDEQSALRRVAELVAHGVEAEALFAAVAVEASRLIDDEPTNLVRFDAPRRFTVVATHGGPAPVGLQVEIPEDDTGVGAEVLRTHRPARRDDYQIKVGPLFGRDDYGRGSSVSVPIIVGGGVWGMLGTLTEGRRLPDGTEQRLQAFAELVAAALSNSQARAEVQQLADEQSALRRIAELVVRGGEESELFDAVALEAAGLVGDEATTLVRYEGDRTFTVLATRRGPVPRGTRFVLPPGDRGTMDQMLRNPRDPVRLDDYGAAPGPLYSRDRFGVGSSVSVPILVEDRLWGMLGVLTEGRRLPDETEDRLQKFAELVAAALANNQARAEVRQLADEQTALRRIADRVARGLPSAQVFAAVAVEAGRLTNGEAVTLTRFAGEHEFVVLASSGGPVPVGQRVRFPARTLPDRLRRDGGTDRVDDHARAPDAALARGFGVTASVGAAISVEGRTWGTLTATSATGPLGAGTEHRLSQFADLVGAAIANAEYRTNLTVSRARVVATADETRRRIQRDVHDGAQQRLVQTVITLHQAREAAVRGRPVTGLLDEAVYHAERADRDLRELVQGIMPASLSRGGLRSGIESLLADLPLVVGFELAAPRLETATEITAYFVVAEALTNVVKHAHATEAEVRVLLQDATLLIEVRDNGSGGADPARGTGLTGLSDRIAAAEGQLEIESPSGQGTTIRARLPAIARPGRK